MTTPRFVISYDVTDNRRRRHVSTTLQAYGNRIQKSVFEVAAEPEVVATCIDRLRSLLAHDEDSVAVYRLCRQCSGNREYLGSAAKREPIGEEEIFIV
jgi:CRISPR-associated protein Cas2